MDEKERIEKIMQTENLNSTLFAIEIGIQSSTLSHILNGRNKPSLDVLKRILNRFRTINSDWLILGVGSMYRQERNSQALSLFDQIDENGSKTEIYTPIAEPKSALKNEPIQIKAELESQTDKEKDKNEEVKTDPVKTISKKAQKIIIYYSDNTFEEFYP